MKFIKYDKYFCGLHLNLSLSIFTFYGKISRKTQKNKYVTEIEENGENFNAFKFVQINVFNSIDSTRQAFGNEMFNVL